ncbi:MAG TPA: DUF5131 family protein [Verrucomicrobiae bacterium]|nr:DUF5131 family protein [Verrucomicrobiae bacterium]
MKDSSIQWTDHTFNPWIGCTRVSPGCQNCYAEGGYGRRFGIEWGPGKPRRRTTADYWKQALAWDRQAARKGVIPRVFCGSLCDWLDPDVPPEWRRDLLELIGRTPNLGWMLLSKRPQLWRRLVGQAAKSGGAFAARWLAGEAPHNAWAGTTVEDQRRAEGRIPRLLEIPAARRFLSCEPLLGPIAPDLGGVDLVIGGGESGKRARPLDIRWARDLRDRCRDAGVAFFMKQCGSNPVESGRPLEMKDDHGGDPDEWPEDLRVREMPGAFRTPARVKTAKGQ